MLIYTRVQDFSLCSIGSWKKFVAIILSSNIYMSHQLIEEKTVADPSARV